MNDSLAISQDEKAAFRRHCVFLATALIIYSVGAQRALSHLPSDIPTWYMSLAAFLGAVSIVMFATAGFFYRKKTVLVRIQMLLMVILGLMGIFFTNA